MNKTSIEWADYVWNPVTGCTKVSEGCRHCYAEAIAKRFWGERKFGDVMCHPERLDQPVKVKKPGRVFVNSMSDLFHPDVPLDFVDAVWVKMQVCKWHDYIVLTKRPERMFEYCQVYGIMPSPNIWLGVSVENQRTADERIPLLLQTPAAVRFVSVEPILDSIDLWQYLDRDRNPIGRQYGGSELDWVICGGESGPKARQAHPAWVRELRDQCVAAGVPFFLKQMQADGKMTSMPELDGQIWDQYPGGDHE